jgi:hypothetical protein
VERDLTWLVQFQVLGWSWNRTAASHHETVTWDAVRKAVKRMAELLGLRLRTES